MKSDEKKKPVSMKASLSVCIREEPKIHKLAQTFSVEGTIIVVFGADKFPEGGTLTRSRSSQGIGRWR